jgi:hypothetical protein
MTLTADEFGDILGAGSAGQDSQRYCLAWRLAKDKFHTFLPGSGYVSGPNEQVQSMAADADENIIMTGISGAGSKAGILTIKFALPHYRPPPNMPLTPLR